MIVLDASAAVFAFREREEFPDDVRSGWLEDSDERIVAPDFFCVEATHAAWKHVHVGAMSEAQASAMAQVAIGYIDEFVSDSSLLPESLDEAIRLDHSVYDMLYFVLARRNGAQLVTCDRQLAKLCAENNVDCVVLLDF